MSSELIKENELEPLARMKKDTFHTEQKTKKLSFLTTIECTRHKVSQVNMYCEKKTA